MFSLNCPLKLPGFPENLNVSTHFSTAHTKFHEYSFSSLEVLHADGDIKTWRTQHAHFIQFWIRTKKISKVSNRVSQRPCHKPASYPTKTPGRQNSKVTDMSVPFKHFLVSKCLRQLKASAAIKDCLLYEGVNLLLASYSEGGGGYLWINASVVLNRPPRHLAHHLCSSDIIKTNTQHLLQYVCHTFKKPRFTTAAAVSHNMIDGHCFNIWISKSECSDITDDISTSNSSKTRLRSLRDVMRRALLLEDWRFWTASWPTECPGTPVTHGKW